MLDGRNRGLHSGIQLGRRVEAGDGHRRGGHGTEGRLPDPAGHRRHAAEHDRRGHRRPDPGPRRPSTSRPRSSTARPATPFLASAYTDNPVRYIAAGAKYTLNQSLMCAKVGERYALTSTAAAAFGKGALSGQYGIADDDTLVLVIDIVANYLGKAERPQPAPAGRHADRRDRGRRPARHPGAPDQAADDRRGSRRSRPAAEPRSRRATTVVVNYTGWTWPTTVGDVPSQFDGTWEPARSPSMSSRRRLRTPRWPCRLGSSTPSSAPRSVSRSRWCIPPKDGFGSATPPSGVDATSTLIYVIDILGIVKK